MYAHKHECVCLYAHVDVCVHVCIYVCMSMYVCMYVSMYTVDGYALPNVDEKVGESWLYQNTPTCIRALHTVAGSTSEILRSSERLAAPARTH